MENETAEARQARLGTGLEGLLAKEFGAQVEVSGIVETSAGARRNNVLFDARVGGAIGRYCATIMPTPDIELKPIPEEAALIQLAEQAGVRVPHVHFASEDASWVGGPVFVSD
ncbi:MAG: hypothetical protein MK142_09335, partial [Pseudomonadales bacterium]|nr:hypothetical protein [Pseudomonadales bacterium]